MSNHLSKSSEFKFNTNVSGISKKICGRVVAFSYEDLRFAGLIASKKMSCTEINKILKEDSISSAQPVSRAIFTLDLLLDIAKIEHDEDAFEQSLFLFKSCDLKTIKTFFFISYALDRIHSDCHSTSQIDNIDIAENIYRGRIVELDQVFNLLLERT